MPEKKKTLAAKTGNTENRMSKPQASKNSKIPEVIHKNAASSTPASGGPKQLAVFEKTGDLTKVVDFITGEFTKGL